jgi:hypothetical protein
MLGSLKLVELFDRIALVKLLDENCPEIELWKMIERENRIGLIEIVETLL